MYNKKRSIIENGVNYKPEVNVNTPGEKLKNILANKDFDIKSPGVKTFRGVGKKLSPFKTNTNTKTEDKEINKQVIETLQSINFYGLNKNTTKSNLATHGFNFSHMKSKGNKASTIESAVEAWSNITKMRNMKYGSLFTFDMETFGGTSKDKRWNPWGITEFAMHEFDFATNKRTTTNILMTDKDVINGLEKFKTKYKEVYNKGQIDAIKADNELWVTAMRMSLYDPNRGAKLFVNEKGYAEVANLLETSEAEAGNIDSVMRGVQYIIDIANQTKTDDATGLNKGTMAYLESMGKVQKAMSNGTGVISGHNIINFDRPVAEQAINKIWESNINIVNNPSKYKKSEVNQAMNALQYMNQTFGGKPHLTFTKGKVLDTLPIAKAAIDELGMDSIYNLNDNATLNKFGGKTASLEALSNVFLDKQINEYEGVAHLGVFDSYINQELIIGSSERLGTSFVDYVINRAGKNKTGLKGILDNNTPVTMQKNQLFKAVNNITSFEYSGKAPLNFVKYDNGEIYTNTKYHIKDGKVTHSNFAGNTGFTKGLYYSNTGSERIDMDLLPADVQKMIKSNYPELNSQYVYKTSFHTVSNNNKGFVGHEVSFFTTTQEEMEGMIGNNLVHVANKEKDQWNIIEESRPHLSLKGINAKTGKIFTPFNAKDKTSTQIVNNAIDFSISNIENDRALRSVFNGATSVKKIEALLEFNKEIESSALGEKVSSLLEDGITMSELIFNGEAFLNKKEAAILSGTFKRHVGYKPKGKKETIADFRTVQNMAVAYDKVVSRKSFYQNAIDITKEKFKVESISKGMSTKKNRAYDINEFFKDLVNRASYYSEEQAGLTGDKLINGARDLKGYIIKSESDLSNRYDFKLGDNFVFGNNAKNITKVFGTSNEDIISFNLNRNNAGISFMNDLRKLYMGADKDTKLLPEDINRQNRQVMYNFLNDLNSNKDENKALFAYEPLNNLINNMLEDPTNFNEHAATDVLENAIRYAKEQDLSNGLIKGLNVESVLDFSPRRSKRLNALSKDIMSEISEDINTTHTYDKNTKSIVNKLMSHYSISEKEFEKRIAHMSDVDKVRNRMIKSDVDEKLRTMFTDILNTSNQHGINLHLGSDGTLAVSKNGKGEILDKIPKFGIDENGVMYLQSGGVKTGLALRMKTYGEGKDKRVRWSTNLDDDFGNVGYFERMFNNMLYETGEVDIQAFDKFIGYHKKESREWAMYTGSKMDTISINSRADISAVTELYGEMFKKNGELSYLLDDIKLINKDLPAEARKKMYSLRDGNMPPDLRFLEVTDKIALAKAAYDTSDPQYKDAMYLLEHAGMGLKDVHVSKDMIQIGDRVIGNFMNKYDNVQRPPMYGSGNIKFLKTNSIEEIQSDRFVLSGSILESEKTLKNIYRNSHNLQLTSDITHRQAYMSGPMINEIMRNKKSDIIKANIDNITVQEMTEKAKEKLYDKLREDVSSGTFEQARIMDARLFNNIIDMPLDVQYFSPNKDMYSVISNKEKNQAMYQRLIDLMGEISIDKNNKVTYKRRAGTIVDKGEKLAEYEGFGGVLNTVGSKHTKGVMSYSIRTKENIELTDKQISELLTNNIHIFEGLESNEERLNAMFGLLKTADLKAQYKIENINRSSLPKILDSGSEKGMTRILNSTVGELDETNRLFFVNLSNKAKTLGLGDKYNLTGKYALSDLATNAILEDISVANGSSVEELIKELSGGKFNNVSNVLERIHSEQYAKSDILFGSNGVFKGVTSLANDNILKHNNQGLNVSSTLAEAIGLLGKSMDSNNELNKDSYNKALNFVVKAINNDDNLNMFRQTINGAESDVVRKLKIKGSQIIISDIPENEKGYINNNVFVDLLKYINDEILIQNEKQNRLTQESDKLIHENIEVFDGKKYTKEKEWIGTGIFTQNEDGTYRIIGGVKTVNSAIVQDGETVSGVSQEFINARKEIIKLKELKKQGLLDKAGKEKLEELQDYVAATKEFAKFNRFDDQAFAIMGFNKFNNTLSETIAAELKTGEVMTEEKLNWLSKQTGNAIRKDKDKIIFDAELNNKTANQIWIDKVKASRFYNGMSEELTEEMLNEDEYKHLRKAYNAVVGQGRADKISVDKAQEIYELSKVNAGAIFNNDNIRGVNQRERLINEYGYEPMHIKDFIDANGSTHQETMLNTIGKRDVLLDLGEDLEDNKRYLAIPSMSQEVGNEEILASWQGKVRTLKSQYDKLQLLEGDGKSTGVLVSDESIERREKIIENMRNTADEITKLTDSYVQKEKAYGQATKVEIADASQRLKILSITSDAANNEALKEIGVKQKISESSKGFMSNAVIVSEEGIETSLLDLEKKGINNDFARVGRDYFENAGYFNPKTLKEYGFTTEKEMEDYLSKYGTMRTATRHPQIMSSSVYNTRVYYDSSMNGTNAISVSASSMLKYKGDSDGDSESGLNTTIDNITFGQYERARQRARQNISKEGLSDSQYREALKKEVINKYGITEDAYEQFYLMNAEMSRAATMENVNWNKGNKATLIKDVSNNIKSSEANNMIYQLKDATSETFKNNRFEAINYQPTDKELETQINSVKEAITIALQNKHEFNEKEQLIAKSIAEGTKTIAEVEGAEKYSIIDKSMAVLEKSNIDKNTFSRLQAGLIGRVQSQQYFEEAIAKSTKGAIGSVNSSLYALKTATRDLYNELGENIIPRHQVDLLEAMYQLEEQVISGKKVAFEVNDTRLEQIQDIFRAARKGEATPEHKVQLENWLNKYTESETSKTIYNAMNAAHRQKPETIKKLEGYKEIISDQITNLTDDELETMAINKYIANTLLDTSNNVASNPTGKALIHNYLTTARNQSSAELTNKSTVPGLESSLVSQTKNIINDIETAESERILERSSKQIANAGKHEFDTSALMLDAKDFIAQETPSLLSPNMSKSLGVASIGIAAALLVTGYAGAHNASRPTPPIDDTQPPPQSVPDFFNQQPSEVRPTGDQQGYIINIKADTKKGERHLKRAMKEAARVSQTGNVNINMNYRTTSSGGFSNKDIEDLINNYI